MIKLKDILSEGMSSRDIMDVVNKVYPKIVKAFKEFMNKAKRTEWGLKYIYFEPSKTQGDARSDSQRRKLYLAYVKKHLKGAKIRNFRDGVVIEF